jgi:hypothetical protein
MSPAALHKTQIEGFPDSSVPEAQARHSILSLGRAIAANDR